MDCLLCNVGCGEQTNIVAGVCCYGLGIASCKTDYHLRLASRSEKTQFGSSMSIEDKLQDDDDD